MWNNFDFAVVAVSLVGMVLEAAGFSRGDLAIARVLRFLRGARILRILRVVKVFRALATIMECFRRCAVPMFWCFAMMVLFLFIFALVFMDGVASFLSSPAGRELEAEEPTGTRAGSAEAAGPFWRGASSTRSPEASKLARLPSLGLRTGLHQPPTCQTWGAGPASLSHGAAGIAPENHDSHSLSKCPGLKHTGHATGKGEVHVSGTDVGIGFSTCCEYGLPCRPRSRCGR